jgi:excisionase family DNA binding protein
VNLRARSGYFDNFSGFPFALNSSARGRRQKRSPPVREVIPPHPTPAARGYTPNELARLLRVSPDRIRAWIKAGELGAIDTARHRCGRPRYVILPVHLEEFERRRRAATTPTKPAARRRRRTATAEVDYYPD